MDQLSESRRGLLLSLGLCTAADLRRAGRLVRRLARGLPAFDSVWVDALVRLGKLTAFQARLIESSQPERIRVGPCVLRDRLGGGPLGETFLASTGPRGDTCAIKLLAAAVVAAPEVETRLTGLIEGLRGFEHPSIATPVACERVDERRAIVSRYVAGPHLGTLLVRRGRFPAAVVWEIGRQLADGLRALAERGVAHGDIRAANVRVTKSGTAVLVDPGIRPAVDAQLSVHSALPPDRYDGVAPELIGIAASPTCATDMYALGCLLWQLLAGRPPFPGGDPLVKLAAHRTRSIDDVRRWAPETPPLLAEGIRRMTARNPQDRPRDFTEVLAQWGLPRRSGRRRLAAFRRWFDAPAPMGAESSSRPRSGNWPAVTALLAAVALTGIVWRNPGTPAILLSWQARLHGSSSSDAPRDSIELPPGETARPGPTDPPKPETPDKQLAEVPAPDPHGAIRLPQGEYVAREIVAVGALSILGEGPHPVEIVVRDGPLILTAETVRLENVSVRHVPPADRRQPQPETLVSVDAQSLRLEHCRLDAFGPGGSRSRTRLSDGSSLAGVTWKLTDPRDPQGGRAVVRNTVFLAGDCAVRIVDAARQVEFINCLRVGGGPLCGLAMPRTPRIETLVRLRQTTCRASDSVFRVDHSADVPPPGGLKIEANDCVFDLSVGRSALFEIRSAFAAESAGRIRLTGEGSLASSNFVTAVSARDGDPHRLLEAPADMVEGIMTGPYRFAGEAGPNPADSEIREYEAPRRSEDPPGIRAADVPASRDMRR